MNEIDLIKKHLSPRIPFVLKNEDGSTDTIYLKKLSIGQQALAQNIAKDFQNIDKDAPINIELAEKLVDFMTSVIQSSVDGIDIQTAKEFVNTNFAQLMEIITLLTPQTETSKGQEALKKRLEQANVKSADK